MTQMKPMNTKTNNSPARAAARMLGVSIPATMVLSAALAMGFAIALDGCSSKSHTGVTTKESAVKQTEQPAMAPTPQPAPVVESSQQVVIEKKKKPAVRKAATLTYRDQNYGITFRYPEYYKLRPKEEEKADVNSAWPDPVPVNFGQPGGLTLATLKLPNRTASSFFKVSVNKDVTSEQCGQFSSPAPSEVDSNPPVDSSDASIPSKTNIRGVEFIKVESATEQTDVQYYHHFEPGSPKSDILTGTCYEFALGVAAAPDNSGPVDYLAMLDRMERILATVKIKPETVPAVTASVPEQPSTGNNPQ